MKTLFIFLFTLFMIFFEGLPLEFMKFQALAGKRPSPPPRPDKKVFPPSQGGRGAVAQVLVACLGYLTNHPTPLAEDVNRIIRIMNQEELSLFFAKNPDFTRVEAYQKLAAILDTQENKFHYAQIRYDQGHYGEEAFRQLKQISESYTELVTDPGLMAMLPEFLVFTKEKAQELGEKFLTLSPWDMRRMFEESLGTETFYRVMYLPKKGDHLEKVNQSGILSPYFLKDRIASPFMPLAGPIQIQYENRMSNNLFPEEDVLTSITKYPQVGIMVSGGHKGSKIDQENSIYVFPMNISPLNVLSPERSQRIFGDKYNGIFADYNPLPKNQHKGVAVYESESDSEEEEGPRGRYKEGVELFVPFRVERGEIDFSNIEEISYDPHNKTHEKKVEEATEYFIQNGFANYY